MPLPQHLHKRLSQRRQRQLLRLLQQPQRPNLKRKPRAGDIVFAHTKGTLGRLIRLGERIRWQERASRWNHACVVSRVSKGEVYVIEATLKGVVESPLSKYPDHAVIAPPAGVDVKRLVEFQKAQLGSSYGVLSILCIATDLVTGNWFPSLRRDGSWICSALTAEGLRAAGWFTPASNFGDIYTPTPAQVWVALTGHDC